MCKYSEAYKALKAKKKIQSSDWLGPIRDYIRRPKSVSEHHFTSALAVAPEKVLDGYVTWGPQAIILYRQIHDSLEDYLKEGDKDFKSLEVIGLTAGESDELSYGDDNYRRYLNTSGDKVDLPDGVHTAASILYRCKETTPAVIFNTITERCYLYARVVVGREPPDIMPVGELQREAFDFEESDNNNDDWHMENQSNSRSDSPSDDEFTGFNDHAIEAPASTRLIPFGPPRPPTFHAIFSRKKTQITPMRTCTCHASLVGNKRSSRSVIPTWYDSSTLPCQLHGPASLIPGRRVSHNIPHVKKVNGRAAPSTAPMSKSESL